MVILRTEDLSITTIHIIFFTWQEDNYSPIHVQGEKKEKLFHSLTIQVLLCVSYHCYYLMATHKIGEYCLLGQTFVDMGLLILDLDRESFRIFYWSLV